LAWVAGPRTKRGRWALGLATAGALLLVASAFSSWVEPAHVSWPSYTDGVPDFISHPSDGLFRLGAGLIGAGALVLVGLARRGVGTRLSWVLFALLGLGGIALGLVGLDTATHYRGFGSMFANGITLSGFHHSPLNYAELVGASLLCLSPLAALQASRSTGR
jgi:hypothetical protein